MNDVPPDKFLSPALLGSAIRLMIRRDEHRRTLLWLVFWLIGIPLGMVGYLSMLLWAYGAAG